jgi:hypothetical protein
VEVLLAERTSDEANQEILAVIVDAGMPEKKVNLASAFLR